MAEADYLKTISSSIDEKSRDQKIRHTLQPKTNTVMPINAINDTSSNRQRSQSFVQPTKIMIQPSILEEEDEEQVKFEDGSSTRTSFAKKNPPKSRNNSMVGIKAKIIEVKGYENGGFNGDMTNQGFQRGYMNSSRSSTHDSMHSLQVQSEQYCCFSRWSPFEKRLATSVAILAGVIIGLVIAVGLLANREGVDENFIWKP